MSGSFKKINFGREISFTGLSFLPFLLDTLILALENNFYNVYKELV